MSKTIPLATLHTDCIITEDSDSARQLHASSHFGTIHEKKVMLTFHEGCFLLEKNKLKIVNKQDKSLSLEDITKKATKLDKNFWISYAVYNDLRKRGYTVKTGLKFGAEFRVYDRGVKPGADHAKWIVFPVHEQNKFTWYDFASKNRVAHSTKKRLMIALVDSEHTVTYYEVQWMRP